MESIISSERIGLNYRKFDDGSLYDSISVMINNIELRNEMSENALSVFERKYNSDKIYSEYVEYLENMQKCRQGVDCEK